MAIVSRNGPEYIIFYWAIHMIGGVSVLVNAWQTKTVILACLNLTNPKVVMVDDQRAAQALEGEDLSQYGIIDTVVAKPTRKYRSLKAWDEWVPKPGRFPALPSLDSLNIQPEDEATIYFTSGERTPVPDIVWQGADSILLQVPPTCVGAPSIVTRSHSDDVFKPCDDQCSQGSPVYSAAKLVEHAKHCVGLLPWLRTERRRTTQAKPRRSTKGLFVDHPFISCHWKLYIPTPL